MVKTAMRMTKIRAIQKTVNAMFLPWSACSFSVEVGDFRLEARLPDRSEGSSSSIELDSQK